MAYSGRIIKKEEEKWDLQEVITQEEEMTLQ